MKIGILKTDQVKEEWISTFGDYPDMFARLLQTVKPDLELVTYEVQQFEYPKDLDEVDAYLITGSRFSAYDDEEWIHRLGAFVQELYSKGKKIIGICFGHQLIAHFLGGKTVPSEKGWGIGIYSMNMTLGQNFAPEQKTLSLIYSHKDQVVLPVPGSEILAGNAFCPIGACKIGNQVLTVQGHPEFSGEYARKLAGSRESWYEPTHFAEAMKSLDEAPNDSLLVAQWIIDFIKSS